MRFKARFVTSGVLAALVYGLLGAPAALSADNQCWSYRTAERGFTWRMNQARRDGGMSKMTLDPELSRVARFHTREMVRSAKLHHTPSNKLSKRVTEWVSLGENVGVGGGVESLHQAFMASPSHRDNIMRAIYRYVGVGTRRKDGRLWVTVVFEAVTNPGTTLSMPSCRTQA